MKLTSKQFRAADALREIRPASTSEARAMVQPCRGRHGVERRDCRSNTRFLQSCWGAGMSDTKVNRKVRLDFEQRQRACELENDVASDEYASAAEIIFLRDELERLRNDYAAMVRRSRGGWRGPAKLAGKIRES